MNQKVAILRCADYASAYQALSEAVDLAGGFEVQGKRVLLKPNIVYDAAPERAITTHPLFLEAAVRLVQDRGAARIMVGDSPGLHRPGFSGKKCALGEVCRRMGVEWRDFSQGKIEYPCPKGKAVKRLTLTDTVRDADCIISLPKCKTHQLMLFTGAMKNLFGLMPSVLKSACHVRFPKIEDFAALLVDLNEAVMADYALMDAVIGMEGPGPGSGSPRALNLVLASSNLLALDIAACGIIGYPPAEVPVNREALGRRIWLEDFSAIEYPGLKIEAVRVWDYEKIPLKKARNQLLELLLPRSYRQFRERLTPRPVVDGALCRRCGDCARICGSQAITYTADNQPRIDYRACIRCYCCHEICPAKAVSIRKVSLREALSGYPQDAE